MSNTPKNAYEPWKPPFRYNPDTQWIEDSNGQRLLEIRGWGYLTGRGHGGLGMDGDKAASIQDAIGQRVAELMNVDQEANSRLIVAAPDMLAALRLLVDAIGPAGWDSLPATCAGGYDQVNAAADAAQKAIDKAEGRP